MKFVIDTDALTITPMAVVTTSAVPADSVYLPVTGHILQRPIEADFSYSGYVIRVAPPGQNDSMTWQLSWAQWVAAHDGNNPTREQWPEVLDRYFNIDVYDPAGKAARAAEQEAKAKQKWVATDSPADDTTVI